MATKYGRLGIRTLAGTMVAAVPVAAACSQGPTYDQWAATDGAAGRINLDDVQQAFKDSESATEFERKVNEIYEGDGIVLVRAKQDEVGLTIEGWEDLSNPANYDIDDTEDDLLFTIVKNDEGHDMRGYGSNGYYRSGFGAGDFLFTYLLISAISPRGYYYSTPPGYARTTVKRQRDSYRQSNRYRSQVSRNSKYFSNAPKKYGSSQYANAGRNQSTARQTYKGRQQSTGSFKTSSTGVRSSWGARSSGGRSGFRGGRGGFRGGGGGQHIIGPRD